MLFAHALHFVRDADLVLARLVERLCPGGRVVLVEYDRRTGNGCRIRSPIARLPELAASAGLSTPEVTAKRPSAYAGDFDVAAATRPPDLTERSAQGP